MTRNRAASVLLLVLAAAALLFLVLVGLPLVVRDLKAVADWWGW